MTQKVYKTARGKTVDLGALIMKNEKTRAVGNMGVNARGDRVDPQGSVVDSKNSATKRSYDAHVSNVVDAPVVSSPRKTSKPNAAVQPRPVVKPEPVVQDPEVVDPMFNEEIKPPKQPVGGLAAAIAASKTVKQEPLKTPKQESRDKDGVSKI